MKLEDPATIRKLWIGATIVLLLLALADLLVHHHEHFGVDGTPGFYSIYGFVVCAAMVFFSKFVIGLVLKRKDTFYDD